MPPLGRAARPLLRTVGNKRHANDEDHEELKQPQVKKKSSLRQERLQRKEEQDKENAITASPESSDNELATPPTRPTRTPRHAISTRLEAPDAELKKPQLSTRARREPRHSMTSVSSSLDADHVDDEHEHGRRDEMGPPASSSGSTNGGFEFGMQFSSQGSGKSKVAYGKKRNTVNIHTQPRSVKRFGKSPRVGQQKLQTKIKDTFDADEASELSDVSVRSVIMEDVEDKELRGKKSHVKHRGPEPLENRSTVIPSEEDSELMRISTVTRPPKKFARSARLLGRLGNWMESKDLTSSQEGLEDLDEYLQQLPSENGEGMHCTLCEEPVQLEDYWEFWKGKDQTVKNHTAFCFAHRKKSAQAEYRESRYPDIDWTGLYQRIRSHRMMLFQLLYNQRSSPYRDRYEPLALTGKAAAVPSRRRDLPTFVQEELDSYALDDQSTFPGYYGPHGRRVITEHIMKELKNEIKNCKDPVVQSSGPAAFVQAVLVPEVAVQLIMEDCRVDRTEAEEIREHTCEMGMLLNEEIEDEIEPQHESEDENDYHGQ